MSRCGLLYPEWGWGTEDSAQALSYLKRFWIDHSAPRQFIQILQKGRGNVYLHTARSTAFPQPAPGTGRAWSSRTVTADNCAAMLGLTAVTLCLER